MKGDHLDGGPIFAEFLDAARDRKRR